jgi:hypothetical protein
MDTANYATKGDIAEVKELMQGLIEKTETSLLTAFYKYAEASERRMFATETVTHTLSDRVAAIETRMREWERKH